MRLDALGVLSLLLATVAVAAIVAFLGVAVARLAYPFPLEVNEAAGLRQVERILRGEPLYAAPTSQHVPLVYGPLSFSLAALVAPVAGPGYLALRLVSLVASVGTLVLVYRLVRFEGGSRTAGLVAAGLLAAAGSLAEHALDLGRVDALFVFLQVAAFAAVRIRRSWGGLALSGVLVGLAALTKLPLAAAPVSLALALHLALTTRPRAHVLVFVAAAGLTIATALLLLRAQSGPWPTWYLWDLPRQHAIHDRGDLLGRFWLQDLLPRFPVALLLGPVALVGWASRRAWGPATGYGLVAAASLGGAWASRSNNGGGPNVLLPALAALALLFALALHEGFRRAESGSEAAGLRAFLAYGLLLGLVQFGLLAYNPRLEVPYRSEQWAAERLAATLSALPGPLFAPDLDGYLRGSDKGEQPQLGAVRELLGDYGGRVTPEGERWSRDLGNALTARRYQHVVVDLDRLCCFLEKTLGDYGYVSTGPLFPPGDEYWLWVNGRSPTNLQVFVPGAASASAPVPAR